MSIPTKTHGEHSVYQFFQDGSYEELARFISVEEAMIIVGRFCTNVAAKTGITQRVIITDGGDFTNFEWVYGKGVVFPPPDLSTATH